MALALKLAEDWLLAILTALLLTAVGIVWIYHRVGAFASAYYVTSKLRFSLRVFRHRSGIRLVTLDDYVALLEQLRESLVHYQPRLPVGSTIHVCVFTGQLPRDWPLWA